MGLGHTSKRLKRLCLGGGNGIMHGKKKSEDIGEETIFFGGFVCLGIGYILWRVYKWGPRGDRLVWNWFASPWVNWFGGGSVF